MQRAQQRILNADEEFMRATAPRPGAPAGDSRSAAARAATAALMDDSDVSALPVLLNTSLRKMWS